jgi:hypothetical protein
MPTSYPSIYNINKQPPPGVQGRSSKQEPRIPNYFGFWGQDLSAYFWNPSLAVLAARKQMGDDSPPPPLVACPNLNSPPTNDHANTPYRNCHPPQNGNGNESGVGVF